MSQHENPPSLPEAEKITFSKNFSAYASIEKEIRSSQDGVTDNTQTEYLRLGEGEFKTAYGVEIDGQTFAIKLLKPEWTQNPVDVAELTDRDVDSLLKGRGIAHLEQLIAYNPETGTQVTTWMNGKRATKLTMKEKLKISDDHLVQLDKTLKEMSDAGITHHNLGGVLYDVVEGFNFVDYSEIDNGNNTAHWIVDAAEFMHYLMIDWDKRERAIEIGMNGSRHFETTGLRAMQRAIMVRKARKAQEKYSKREVKS